MNHIDRPFALLGVSDTATEQEVRQAYRLRVKECHPDRFHEPEAQKTAQDLLVRLNLAYEEALRQLSQRRVGFNLVGLEEAMHFARRLVAQGNLQSALRQLNRADRKTAEWYALQGDILMGLRQYDTAHQSYRAAVKLEPDERRYRQGALDAAVLLKKSKTVPFKVQTWLEDTFKVRR